MKFVLAFIAALLVAASAQAALIVKIDSTSIIPSPTTAVTGTVDIVLQLTGGTTANIGSYNVRVDVTPADGKLTLTGAQTAPNALFSGQTAQVFGTGTLFRAGDNLPGVNQEVAAFDGAGLLRIPFTLAAGATGDYTLTLNPVETNLSAAPGGTSRSIN